MSIDTIEEAEIDLGSVIRSCIKHCDGRNKDAAEMLRDLAEENDNIYRMVMDDLLYNRCYDLVTRKIVEINKDITSSYAHRSDMIEPLSSVSATRDVNRETANRKGEYAVRLFDMTIFGMGRLGSLTFAQVGVAEQRYAEYEQAYGLKRRFMAKIKPLGRQNQVVQDVLSETRLARLYMEAKAA